MIVTSYQTKLIRLGDNLNQLIKQTISTINERSILVVASKAIATSENRFVPKITGSKAEKHELVKKEAELYTEPHLSRYNLILTIKRNFLFVNAGIDESNADHQYLLWPADPQQSANKIWTYVRENYGVRQFGVTVSDSSSLILNWGVVGRAIAYCGFKPLRSYVGRPDLFGRLMTMEQTSVVQSVTDAAVLEMGEGAESRPLAVVSNFTQPVEFVDHVPTQSELAELAIDLEDDVYFPLLKNVSWKKGGANGFQRGVGKSRVKGD